MTFRRLHALVFLGATALGLRAEPADRWVGSWACSSQLVEAGNRPPVSSLAGFTVREIVHVSLGGRKVRLRLSNVFGDTSLDLGSVHLALSQGNGAIDPATDRTVTFSGSPETSLPRGTQLLSDPLAFDLPEGAALAITLRLSSSPRDFNGHPGSRTTSYLQNGDFVSAPTLPDPLKVDHWYFIEGLDVVPANAHAAALVALGDSITDGRGATTNGNDRWPDRLAQRLRGDPATPLSVLNEGIGGNRILHDGLGPCALARFDRDVIAQTGVRWLVVFEGINDLGGGATAREIIAADQQFITRAHDHGIKVLGGTITAFNGFAMYFRPEREMARQEINRWIRESGAFDGVVDFDAATRDPRNPSCLAPENDSGDHLHLTPHGYQQMAAAVDLGQLHE